MTNETREEIKRKLDEGVKQLKRLSADGDGRRFYAEIVKDTMEVARRIYRKRDPVKFDYLIEEVMECRAKYIANYKEFIEQEKIDLTRLIGEVRALAMDKRDILRIRDLKSKLVDSVRADVK